MNETSAEQKNKYGGINSARVGASSLPGGWVGTLRTL